MKKRFLILSYYFAPQNLIGAVRATKFAKYLQRMGCEVTVICGAGMDDRRDPTLEKDLRELADVRVIREWNPLKALKSRKAAPSGAAPAAAAQAAKPSFKQRLRNGAYLFLWVLSDWSFERRGKRALVGLDGTYDAVFSSYAPMSVHAIARLAQKRGLARRWVADFRDEAGVSFRWQEGKRRRMLKAAGACADAITAVSQGTLDAMGFDRGVVLHNGFDREDLPPAPAPGDGVFRAVYCGQFHMGRKGVPDRDVTPILRALALAVEKGALPRERLRLCYAGGEGETFLRYAAACGLADRAELLGSVSREQSLALQQSADLLLMATVNTPAQTGILTGKIFEYLMVGKPICCYVSGSLGGSELKRLLAETGAGFCAEEAAGAADVDALNAYVERLACDKRQEISSSAANAIHSEAYSYPALTKRLYTLLTAEEEKP